ARRDGGAGATARAGGAAGEIVRVVRLKTHRAKTVRDRGGFDELGIFGAAHAAAAAGPLGEINFREDDGAGVAEFFHDVGVVGRDGAFEELRAGGGRQVERVVIILEHD